MYAYTSHSDRSSSSHVELCSSSLDFIGVVRVC